MLCVFPHTELPLNEPDFISPFFVKTLPLGGNWSFIRLLASQSHLSYWTGDSHGHFL